jgi:uncharacterized protein (TIGR02145 family)
MFTLFTKHGLALLLAAALAVGAVCILGCGGESDPGGNSGNNGGGGTSGGDLVYGGKTYKTVVIGSQTWMAENLNFQTSSGSWCYGEGGPVYVYDYDNDKGDSVTLTSGEIRANCNKYGRLYTWEAAKTACPSGWHLPSRNEWNVLAESVGGKKYNDDAEWWELAGKKLKSTTGWYNSGNGTDDYGFSALPGGIRISGGGFDGGFVGAGGYGFWWSSEEYDSGHAYLRVMYYDYDGLDKEDDESGAFSVRCLRD